MTASDAVSFIGWLELRMNATASGSPASEWVFEIIVTREPERGMLCYADYLCEKLFSIDPWTDF